jgi:hypothetical protein
MQKARIVRLLLIRTALLVAMCVTALPLCAETPRGWNFYLGGLGTRFDATGGPRGHTEDCRTVECDESDFERGNLDSSIGYRFGADRRLFRRGNVGVLAGADITVVSTEYNLSQRDFWLFGGVGYGAVEIEWPRVTVDVRAGGGRTWSDDGRSLPTTMVEGGFAIPFGETTALRVAVRRSDLGGPKLRDVSLLIVFPEGPIEDRSRWAYSSIFGVSAPGKVAGRDHSLSRAPLWINALEYSLSESRHLTLAWVSTSHESTRRSTFQGVTGNQRGKTIAGHGLTYVRSFPGGIRLGGGGELANWSDDYELLYDRSASKVVTPGIDFAVTAEVGARRRLARAVFAIAEVQQLYWLDSSLGEMRFLAGVTVSR